MLNVTFERSYDKQPAFTVVQIALLYCPLTYVNRIKLFCVCISLMICSFWRRFSINNGLQIHFASQMSMFCPFVLHKICRCFKKHYFFF